MRKFLPGFLFLLIPLQGICQQSDTFRVYFDLNVPQLNGKSKHVIDMLLYNDRIVPGKDVMIIGYADYLGTEGHNKTLSEKRAHNIEDYLAGYGVDREHIKLCIGKGEIERKGMTGYKGYATDRRVDIVVEKKEDPAAAKGGKPAKQTILHEPNVAAPHTNESISVTEYQPGDAFVLKKLYFYPEQHTIRPESYMAVEMLYNTMKNNPSLKIQIEGHVCCIKDYPDALDIETGESTLSVNRAKAVYYYLAKKGLDTKRMKYVGFGKSKPIVANEVTEEDANKNRRVEIRITEK